MSQEHLGSLIKSRRLELGITQKELGKLLHVSDKAISKWERGISYPDILKLNDVAQSLGVKVSYLLDENEQEFETEKESTLAYAIGTALDVSRASIKKRKKTYIMCATIIIFLVCCSFIFFYQKTISKPYYMISQCVVVEKDSDMIQVKKVIAEGVSLGVYNRVLSDEIYSVPCEDVLIYDQNDHVMGTADLPLESDVVIEYRTSNKIEKKKENTLHAIKINVGLITDFN